MCSWYSSSGNSIWRHCHYIECKNKFSKFSFKGLGLRVTQERKLFLNPKKNNYCFFSIKENMIFIRVLQQCKNKGHQNKVMMTFYLRAGNNVINREQWSLQLIFIEVTCRKDVVGILRIWAIPLPEWYLSLFYFKKIT